MKARQVIFKILLAVFLFPTITFSCYRAYRFWECKKLLHPGYLIDTIVQSGPVKSALPTVLLAELIDLSYDRPTHFFAFDEKKAERQLLNSPVIAKARVKKIKPNKVYIDYEVRQPIALFGDFENMAIDEQRHLFPLSPYFSPKQLPVIVLGEHRFSEIVTGEKIELAFKVLLTLLKAGFAEETTIQKVDVSHAYTKSYGKREIVVVLNHKKEKHYLRLTEKNLASGIANYLSLLQGFDGSEAKRVIDLRIEQIAYVQEIGEEV